MTDVDRLLRQGQLLLLLREVWLRARIRSILGLCIEKGVFRPWFRP